MPVVPESIDPAGGKLYALVPQPEKEYIFIAGDLPELGEVG
jgi:hypothetical protein